MSLLFLQKMLESVMMHARFSLPLTTSKSMKTFPPSSKHSLNHRMNFAPSGRNSLNYTA